MHEGGVLIQRGTRETGCVLSQIGKHFKPFEVMVSGRLIVLALILEARRCWCRYNMPGRATRRW